MIPPHYCFFLFGGHEAIRILGRGDRCARCDKRMPA